MNPILFVNPSSGPDSCPPQQLREAFPGVEVVDLAPDALRGAAAAAVQDGRPWVGVAGGDGTVGAVVQELARSETALLVVPAGTRNHFARDVGIATIEDAAAAATNGVPRPVDVAEVNGRRFVNNASVGLYPWLVQRRERHERRLPKGVASAVAAWEQVRRGRNDLVVEVGGQRYRASMVFVGNGRYGEGLTDLAERESLTTASLDVRVVRADARLARLRVVAALLLGRLSQSPLVVQNNPSSLEVSVSDPIVEVAVDGEVVRLECPLRFAVAAGALNVLVPARAAATDAAAPEAAVAGAAYAGAAAGRPRTMKKGLMIIAGAATVGALVRSRFRRGSSTVDATDPGGSVRKMEKASRNPGGVRP